MKPLKIVVFWITFILIPFALLFAAFGESYRQKKTFN